MSKKFKVNTIEILLKNNKFAGYGEIVSEEQLSSPAADLEKAGFIVKPTKSDLDKALKSKEELQAEKDAEAAAKADEKAKAEKDAQDAADKAEKEAKTAADKAEKEAKEAADKAAVDAAKEAAKGNK